MGFYIRALWLDVEPETEKTRATFRPSIRTEEGQRVLLILLESNQPGMPWPVARWMLQNAAHGPSRAEADRADLRGVSPPSPEPSACARGSPDPSPGRARSTPTCSTGRSPMGASLARAATPAPTA